MNSSLQQLEPGERLAMSRMADIAGYLPVRRARRVRKVFKVLPVWYVGPVLGDPRRGNIPRRALIEP